MATLKCFTQALKKRKAPTWFLTAGGLVLKMQNAKALKYLALETLGFNDTTQTQAPSSTCSDACCDAIIAETQSLTRHGPA